MRVLFVCHGNLWRSPLAEVHLTVLRPDWTITSAGVKPDLVEGRRHARPVREIIEQLGLDPDAYRTRRVRHSDVHDADVIAYMDLGNARRLCEAYYYARPKFRSLAEYVGLSRIPDPNYLGDTPERAGVLDVVRLAVEKFADAERD